MAQKRIFNNGVVLHFGSLFIRGAITNYIPVLKAHQMTFSASPLLQKSTNALLTF
jgi:hypothetical protein